jgi:hypothetical protein
MDTPQPSSSATTNFDDVDRVSMLNDMPIELVMGESESKLKVTSQ